jgi:ferritin-like metal-binding protein YciE
MPIASLHDLMLHELKDVYSAERQLVQALPSMASKATSDELREAFETHLAQTEEQVERLKQVFELLGVAARSQKCKGMEGLIAEGKSLAEEDIEDEVLDAGLIAAAQRVEHYEIAAYGTLVEYAGALGLDEVRELLESTLEEEKQTDQLLTQLAEGGINQLAQVAAKEGDANGSSRRASRGRNGGTSSTKSSRR